ncbi:FAD:protein FMN transferase [Fulvivirga sp. 29W222]|uniref:FAD:protein FMN transferase n=1 Tax=Fulvivirga marina TaxID=2494733 RepID=A0A937G3M7_9BACT|nr:FAD:protein FMN transferase [Fulvivirga marina]MBL6449818.1 FAD:protein FMN transferase [Fulvivirga marina]
MSLRYKNIIYSVVLLLAVFLVWKYRQSQVVPMAKFSGKTMGPITYNVTYFDEQKRDFSRQIDSLLKDFNKDLSTYIPESEISRFNRDSSFKFDGPYFEPVLASSRSIYDLTEGAYDPTVMPLVNAWGFGPEKKVEYDSAYIDSLMQFVGFDKIKFDNAEVLKADPRVQLDFSAAAKGYGVDIVANYLEAQGIENMLVEIGGEVFAKGKNLKTGKLWNIGILDPDSDQINQFYIATASVENKAMATSGNYFNYYVVDGVKYSHTISPFTGFPIRHPLLSASVFANDCMTADALATAFMVLGHEKAIEILEANSELDGYLVYSDASGNKKVYATEGIKPYIKEIE